MSNTYLLYGGLVAFSRPKDLKIHAEPLDVLIRDGVIADARPHGEFSPAELTDVPTVDCTGRHVLPGGVDPHVHFAYEQGPSRFLSAQGWAAGSEAALLGGTTSVIDFVEQLDAPNLIEAATRRAAAAEAAGVHVDFGLHISITDASPASHAAISAAVAAGMPSIKIYTAYAFRVDGREDLAGLAGTAAQAGSLMFVHCEDNQAIVDAVERLTVEGKAGPRFAGQARPASGEVAATKMVLDVAAEMGTNVHIAHVSTGEGAAAIRESADAARHPLALGYGLTRPATGEVCAHHLVLDETLYKTWEHPEDLVMAPALRPRADAAALAVALTVGEAITCSISDNCPFTRAQRAYRSRRPAVDVGGDLRLIQDDGFIDGPVVDSELGEPPLDAKGEIPAAAMPGGTSSVLERYVVTYATAMSGAKDPRVGLVRAARTGAAAAADRFGLVGKGLLYVGGAADIAVFDPKLSTTFVPGPGMDHTLYEGRSVQGAVTDVFKAGVRVVAGGEIDRDALKDCRGRFIKRSFAAAK